MQNRRQTLKRSAALAGLLALATRHGVLGAQNSLDSEATAPNLPDVGAALRLPEVALFDGSVFTPRQAEGHVLVLYWWASWCPFCTLQNPYMEKLWQSQRSLGLQMLALSVDRRREDATNYLQKKGYTFPAGLVTPAIARVLPKPKGLPVTVVRGRDGKVLDADKGQLFPEEVEQLARWL